MWLQPRTVALLMVGLHSKSVVSAGTNSVMVSKIGDSDIPHVSVSVATSNRTLSTMHPGVGLPFMAGMHGTVMAWFADIRVFGTRNRTK